MNYRTSVLVTILAKGIALVVGIVSSIITARYLGPEGRGILAVLVAVQGLAIQFGSFGFNASVTFFLSKEPDHRPAIVSTTVVSSIAGGIIIAAAFAVISFIDPRILIGSVDPALLWILLLSFPFTFLIQNLQNVFLALNEILDFNLLDLVLRILQLTAFAVFLIILAETVTAAVWIVVSVGVFMGMVYVLRVSRLVPLRISFSKKIFMDMARYGLRTYGASFLMYALMRLGLFFTNYTLGERQSGFYAVALQIIDLSYLLPTTLGLLLFPRVSADTGGGTELTAKVFRFTLLASVCIAGTVAVVGRPLIVLLFGAAFEPSFGPLAWLLPGLIALSLVTILNNDLAGRGLPWIVLIAPAIAVVATLGAAAALLPSLGIEGIAGATSLGYCIVLSVLFVYFMRTYRVSAKQLLAANPMEFIRMLSRKAWKS